MTDNIRACLLMVASMAGFTLEDTLIKRVSEDVPIGQILFMLGLGGTFSFGLVAAVGRHRLTGPALLSAPVVVRGLAECFTMLTGFVALAALPLTLVSSVMQAGPVVTTIGAALILGETVGWRRALAVAVGLAGVLLILRPGGSDFEPMVLLVVLSVLGIAVRDLATRVAPPQITVIQLTFWGYVTTIPTGLGLHLATGAAWVMPTAGQWGLLAVAMVLGIVFYYTLTMALRLGESSLVVPFRYSRIVFALILGYLVFDERPDALMLAGMALVVASGVYMLLRETQLARARRRPSPVPVAPL